MKTTNTDFYTALCADLTADECQELRTFRRGGKDDGKPGPRWFGTDPAEIARRARGYPANLDGYYGINPRKRAADPRDQTGKTEDVTRIRFVVTDIDDKHFLDGRAGAIAALAAFPLAPTWVIESGGGLQALWAIVPLVLTGPNDPQIATFQAAQSRLYVVLGGLDAVGDIARVFRLPGTHNAKYDPPRPVAIRHHDPDARYTFDDFLAIVPEPEPAPARPSWTPPTGSAHAANHDEPTRDDIREWLRWIAPTGGYKDHWLKVLAAVHSVYPGADGVDLCEAWSPGKPGEIARKFASFKRPAGGSGAVGVGTLVHLAQVGGWQPARATRSPLPTGDAADLAAEVHRLRADLAAAEHRAEKAERLLSFCQGEHQRKDRRIAELEASVNAYTAALTHPDPTVGGSAFDITDAALAGFSGGDTLIQDGVEYARVVCKAAARDRSAGTVGRAIKRIKDAGTVPIFYRKEQIEKDKYRGDTEIAYVHIPEDIRQSRAATALYLLPSNAVKKQGGARRKITLPDFDTPPNGPVRLLTEHKKIWSSVATERVLKVEPITSTTEYFSDEGEQQTADEVRVFQESIGLRVKAPPAYQPPVQQPLNVVDRELVRPPLDRAGFDHWLDEDEPAPIPITGRRCRADGCGRAPLHDGWCENHAAILAMAAGD
jgi:hypothetical protein